MWASWLGQAAETARSVGQMAEVGAREALERVSLDRLRDEVGQEDPGAVHVTYVTDRIMMTGFPGREGEVAKLGNFLRARHGENFMVWNMSEESYDYGQLGNQVLEYRFPGLPAPPLGMIFKMITSIESWLEADARNVALVHCYTGKGRTATILSCLMSWIGLADSPTSALVEISRLRQVPVERLTIPSQRRYVQYFSAMLEGSRPHLQPVVLRRVILNGVPALESGPSGDGCRPFLQLFRAGRLVFSSLWRDAERGRGLPFVTCDEGSIKFDVDSPLQGDVLLRCRHVAADRSRVSMFRAAFHTGFVQDGMLRFPRAQLDGAAEDQRFAQDFFVELIFSGLGGGGGGGGGAPVRLHPRGEEGAQLADKETRVLDQFLSAESDFWRQVHARRHQRRIRHRSSQRGGQEGAEAGAAGSGGGGDGKGEGARSSGAGAAAGFAFAIEDSDRAAPGARQAEELGGSDAAAAALGKPEPEPEPEPAAAPGPEEEASEGGGETLQEFARLESELGLALEGAGGGEGHGVEQGGDGSVGDMDDMDDVGDFGDYVEGEGEGGGGDGADDDAFLALLDQEMADLGIDNDA